MAPSSMPVGAGTDLTVKNGTISVVDSDGNPLAIELKNGKAKVPAGAKGNGNL